MTFRQRFNSAITSIKKENIQEIVEEIKEESCSIQCEEIKIDVIEHQFVYAYI